MTKDDVSAQGFNMDSHGTITTPGKFEGEPWWALELYDFIMNGGGDETLYDSDTPFEIFNVDKDMATRYDLDPSITRIACHESDQGFFCMDYLTDEDYEKWLQDLEAQEEANEDEEDFE